MSLHEQFTKLISPHVQTLSSLEYRWRDEHEYEDWNDYVEVMKKWTPEGYTFGKASKKPFGVWFVGPDRNKYGVIIKGRGINIVTEERK